MATLVVGESINVKSMWIPALDAVSKALEKARALESNKEQRYLLRLVSTEIQQQQQLLATAPSTPRVTSTSTAVAAASPPASPGRPTSAGSVSPQRGQTGVTSAANGAPAAATTSGIDELSFTMNRVATVVRGYLLHTLAQNRSNQRIVEATLELSHALLNSGVLPVDAQWAPANIPIPSTVNASMLTKMLGTWGSRSTTTEPHAEGSAAPHPPSIAAATMNPFDEIATLNVKVALCVPNQVESPGLYTAITSLLGAVVPDRVSCIDRTCPQQTSFIPSGSFIGLSGPALQTHAYLLFALAVRATTSNMPTLLTIVKGGLSRLIGAIVKELDRHRCPCHYVEHADAADDREGRAVEAHWCHREGVGSASQSFGARVFDGPSRRGQHQPHPIHSLYHSYTHHVIECTQPTLAQQQCGPAARRTL
ncbi:Hypothetical protein, putative [Bodo saltans]|uniref:Uncharacterized protein n=1 Tax=Bodo saltans TaxID=75058 RepID=A0A0S4JRS2_BODSA|nr:Hypothetical protein, putative [Bodo saltans]|eukprot:CUG93040.1 Hypothetical protein, putative [Bodo saltans]